MARFCENCGTRLEPDAVFCPECGTPVAEERQDVRQKQSASYGEQPRQSAPPAAPVNQYAQPAYAQPASRQAYPSQPARQNSSKKKSPALIILIILLAVILAAEGVVAGIWFPGFFTGGSAASPEPVTDDDTETAMVSADHPTVTLSGVTIDVDSYNLRDGDLKASVADCGFGVTAEGARYHEFDVSLGEQSTYDAATTLTFPCKGDPDDYVILHEDHETGGWIPMIGTSDPDNNTITVCTDGFSKFRAQLKLDSPLFFIANKGRPDATVEVSPNYLDVIKKMDEGTYDKTVKEFAADPLEYKVSYSGGEEESDSLSDFIINASGPLAEVLGDADEVSRTAIEHLLDDDVYVYAQEGYKSSISRFMTGFTVLNIGLQLTRDIHKHGLKSETTAANLIKNICTNGSTFYSMATGYSSTAFTFTFFGVAMIGMGLDHMTETAQGEQEKYMSKLMDIYYSEVKPFNADEWYGEVNRICCDTDSTVQEAVAKVSSLLDQRAEEFWDVMSRQSGKEFEDLMLEAGIKNIYSISSSKKAALTDKVKNEFRKKFNEQVIPKLEKDITAKQQTALYSLLLNFAAPFNQKLCFNVMERTDMGTKLETQYNGDIIAFGKTVKNKKVIQTGEGWLTQAPESVHSGDGGDDWDDGWEITFTATDYGWLSAGMPDTVFVFEDDKAVKDLKPVTKMKFEQPHAKQSRTENINLSLSQTYAWRLERIDINPNYEQGDPEKVTSFSGDENALYVYWEETVNNEVKKYEDITCCNGRSMDFPSDFVFSCYYDNQVLKPSERSQKSTVIVVHDGASKTFPETFSPVEGDNRNVYHGETVVPNAMEDETVKVMINRGVYSLVYLFKAVPVEEKEDGLTEIVNNCKDELQDFLAKWYYTLVEDGKEYTAYLTLSLVSDTQIKYALSDDMGHKDSYTTTFTFKDGKLNLYKKDKIGMIIVLKDQNHIQMYNQIRGGTETLTRVGY